MGAGIDDESLSVVDDDMRRSANEDGGGCQDDGCADGSWVLRGGLPFGPPPTRVILQCLEDRDESPDAADETELCRTGGASCSCLSSLLLLLLLLLLPLRLNSRLVFLAKDLLLLRRFSLALGFPLITTGAVLSTGETLSDSLSERVSTERERLLASRPTDTVALTWPFVLVPSNSHSSSSSSSSTGALAGAGEGVDE